MHYDCVVVGGGIAGLAVALRLAEAGLSTALIDKLKVGSGASLTNQGIIHSGALYSLLHPQVSALCSEAHPVYRGLFESSIVSRRSAWYVGSPDLVAKHSTLWAEQGIRYGHVQEEAAGEYLLNSEALHCVSVDDFVVSPRSLLLDMCTRCTAAGVEFYTGTTVTRVVVSRGRVSGVLSASGQVFHASNVVLCAGSGISSLLDSVGSRLSRRIKTRMSLVASFESRGMDGAIMSLEYGGPCLSPVDDTTSLAVRYGAPVRWVGERERIPVPIEELTELRRDVSRTLAHGVIDVNSGSAWVCSKTEYSAGAADEWGVEPGYAILDSRRFDDVSGLWSVIPGKLTLALHAARDLVQRMCGSDIGIAPRTSVPVGDAKIFAKAHSMVAVSPWTVP
ncbi:NAD(P)/FAD-dependent oxidoreductase [Streptomyces sp. NPDC051677]|uniref:NAD(P)/FAD-dependent oxidoreductase n=1 Tax=Streptomyces sp. NPDC051677 TaxID=3365669 RepID=UPI0037CD3C20